MHEETVNTFSLLEENEVLIDKAKKVMKMIRTVLKQNRLSKTAEENEVDLRNKGRHFTPIFNSTFPYFRSAKSRARQLLNERMGKYYTVDLNKRPHLQVNIKT